MTDYLEQLLHGQEREEEAGEVPAVILHSVLAGETVRPMETEGQKPTAAAEHGGETGLAAAGEQGAAEDAVRFRQDGKVSGAAGLTRRLNWAVMGETAASAGRAVVTVREQEPTAGRVDIRELDRRFRIDARRYDGDLSGSWEEYR